MQLSYEIECFYICT